MLGKIALSTALVVVALTSAASAEAARKSHSNGHPAVSHTMKQRDDGFNAHAASPVYGRDSVIDEQSFDRNGNNGW